MHHNFYFLKRLAKALRAKLLYARLKQCFTQEKEELMLGFECQDGSDFWMKSRLSADFTSFQFLNEFQRAGRNSVDLFSELLLAEVQELRVFENERAFGIEFLGAFHLVFKWYGQRANVVLFRDGAHQAQFRKRLRKDLDLDLAHLDRPLDQSLSAFMGTGAPLDVLFPTFGKEIKAQLFAQHWDDLDQAAQWRCLQACLETLENGPIFVQSHDAGLELSLFERPGALLHYQGMDPLAALNTLYQCHWNLGRFHQTQNLLKLHLEKECQKAALYLRDLALSLENKTSGERFEQLGHLIMANLHAIPVGIKSISLEDLYLGGQVQVKLNSEWSPIENAENYYRKAKHADRERETLEARIKAKTQQIQDMQADLVCVLEAKDMKALKPFMPYLSQATQTEAQEASLPFKTYRFEGWDIWVGKSAKSNDLLSFKYAKKEDVWLHARDAAGSHVLIRNPKKGPIPRPVLEKAAALAAFYSKRKGESLCPVVHTPKKFIRKPKGMLPGQVLVEKESVIMVQPQDLV